MFYAAVLLVTRSAAVFVSFRGQVTLPPGRLGCAFFTVIGKKAFFAFRCLARLKIKTMKEVLS